MRMAKIQMPSSQTGPASGVCLEDRVEETQGMVLDAAWKTGMAG